MLFVEKRRCGIRDEPLILLCGRHQGDAMNQEWPYYGRQAQLINHPYRT